MRSIVPDERSAKRTLAGRCAGVAKGGRGRPRLLLYPKVSPYFSMMGMVASKSPSQP